MCRERDESKSGGLGFRGINHWDRSGDHGTCQDTHAGGRPNQEQCDLDRSSSYRSNAWDVNWKGPLCQPWAKSSNGWRFFSVCEAVLASGPEIGYTYLNPWEADLAWPIDFRSVYATLLDQRLNLPASEILGGNFDPPPLLDA